MRRSRRPIRIASRTSMLARAQAHMIGAALSRLHPGTAIEYVFIESEGDLRRDVLLQDAGGKGLFAKAIERALLDDRADLAVHSFKDLPVGETAGLRIAAVPARADVRDCLISHHPVSNIGDLPNGAVVGTASPRRAAQLLRARPDFVIRLIRGNIETRLQKVLDQKQYDATLLAMAGLRRGGLDRYAARPLEPEEMLPAACQGALAVQCRGDDHVTLARALPLNDPTTAEAAQLERSILAGLRGDCHTPIAALAEPMQVNGREGFRLRAMVLSPDGRRCASASDVQSGANPRGLVRNVLDELDAQGAANILATSP